MASEATVRIATIRVGDYFQHTVKMFVTRLSVRP
jgi:hypothetical protein